LLHEMTLAGKTPAAEYSAKCHACSLVGICLPNVTGKLKSVSNYLAKATRTHGDTG